MENFWSKLKKPFLVLAPMEDVTDVVFRQVIAKAGRPSVYFTEFTNADGMNSVGVRQVTQRLRFDKTESPIVAQIWGLRPENFYKAAQIIEKMGFDGVDLNMGCPQKNVISKGACSALMKNRNLAEEIITATIEGAGELPVSVKTRIGFGEVDLGWVEFLLGFGLSALTIHGRTVSEMSKVPAHWDAIAEMVRMRDKICAETLIIGNGDVKSRSEARQRVKESRVDGVMIGRGVLDNPWVFNGCALESVTLPQRLELLQFHLGLFEKTWGQEKPYQVLKKYFKIYISNFDGASELRSELMESKNITEGKKIVMRSLEDLYSQATPQAA